MKHRTRKQFTSLPCQIAAAVASVYTASIAAADVLYDSTWMTDNQTWNGSLHSHISNNDVNVADDFMLGGTYAINTVSADFITNGSGFAGQGVLVEFFSDQGGSPGGTPAIQHFVTESTGLSISSFDTPFSGYSGLRFSMDLNDAGITLGPGTWWMSVVAVHEGGTQGYQWIRQTNFEEGAGIHVRNGGEAHGNGLGGTWGSFDWRLYTDLGPPFLFPPGDMAMGIHGTLVPGPAAFILVLGGLGWRSRQRS